MNSPARMLTVVFCILAFCVGAIAQGPAAKSRKPKIDPLVEARRTMAVSMVTSLAEESRSFRDLVLRARVQSRSADVLWDTDAESARALFRRAWDSAETADEEIARLTEEQRRSQANSRGTTVRRQQPGMRREVLRLAARHDRELGEEFLSQARHRS